MADTKTIPKNPNLKPGEDFAFLREEGIQLIRKLAGLIWTDYNAHDPGITLLEAFSYGLTELGLRASLDMKDIIASVSPNSQSALFAPEVILPSQPVTLKDFQKLLINVEGVRNAWLLPLTLGQAQNVNGLYKLLLELDVINLTIGPSEVPVDLSSSLIAREVTVALGPENRSYRLEVSFPYWDDQDVVALSEIVTIDSIEGAGGGGITLTDLGSQDPNDYAADIRVNYNGGSFIEFVVTVRVSPEIGGDPVENAAVEAAIIAQLTPNLFAFYNQKVHAAYQIRQEVYETFIQHRNLSEDLTEISAIEIQEVGVNCQVEVIKGFHLETYLANVWLKLDQFFAPDIKTYTLEERLEAQRSSEKIYEGPLLDSGFIEDDSLFGAYNNQGAATFRTVYVSDISNILVSAASGEDGEQAPGLEDQVLAIKNLNIGNFIRNRIVTANVTSCLALVKPELFKPRFSWNKSNISVVRDGKLITYSQDLVEAIYLELRNASTSTQASLTQLPFPKGDRLPLGEFRSLQHELPGIYGQAAHIPSDSASPEQRAKAEQLRAVLFAFDQLLANYISQIKQVQDVFSFDETVNSTYSSMAPFDIPYLENILRSFTSSGLSWSDFVALSDNPYVESLRQATESRSVFLERRNRFLNHVLARFGLSLEAYEIYRNTESTKNNPDSSEWRLREEEIAHDLISDKARLIENYPTLSRERTLSYDYTGTVWDSDNLAGLAHRLLTFTGLKNKLRRSLNGEVADFYNVTGGGANWSFEIQDAAANPILESVISYPTEPEAEAAARRLIQAGISRDNYEIDPQLVGSDIEHRVELRDFTVNPSVLWAQSPTTFPTDWDARLETRRIIRELREVGSGMFIIEHVLLRPDTDSEAPAQTDLVVVEEDPTLPVSDPYSMRISIVLPSGFENEVLTLSEIDQRILAETPLPTPTEREPAEFRGAIFRQLITRMITEEVPAHIIPHIFWLDKNTVADEAETPSLGNFETLLEIWLDTKAAPGSTAVVLASARNNLVVVMNEMFQLSTR
ncbi:MAG: hypothetical protein AAFO96_09010 [Bacteroidota bacterium]